MGTDPRWRVSKNQMLREEEPSFHKDESLNGWLYNTKWSVLEIYTCPHLRTSFVSILRTRPDFKKGPKALASGIGHRSQKLSHKTPALGTDHKIQNKIIKPPPKEQPGDNHKNGKYLISEWAICARPYFITWLNIHDIGMQTTDHLWPHSTHQWNFRLPNPSREFPQFCIRRPVLLCLGLPF